MARRPRFGWLVASLLSIGVLATACEPPVPPKVVKVEAAPASARGLKVYVDAPTYVMTDPECRDAQVKKTMANAGEPMKLREALIEAGYGVSTRKADADLVVSFHYSVDDCYASDGTVAHYSSPRLTFVAGDRVLHEAQLPPATFGEGFSECNIASGGVACVLNWPARETNALTKALADTGVEPRARGAEEGASRPAGAAGSSAPIAVTAKASLGMRAGQPRADAYALIIGIERYRDVPSPTGARADAERFAELAKTTLGVPADHVVLRLDDKATKSDLEKELTWLSNNVPASGRIYFFFAGHGAPDPTTQTAFLLPHDGDPQYIATTGIAVAALMNRLSETKAREIVALVDACYSGAGGRSVLAKGTRALTKIVDPRPEGVSRVAMFSSSGSSEISGPASGRSEGLFTSVVIEGLGSGSADVDGDGNVSLGELSQWVTPRVAREAKKDNRDQHPTLFVGGGLGDPNGLILAAGVAK